MSSLGLSLQLVRLRAYHNRGVPIGVEFTSERERDEAGFILSDDPNLLIDLLPPLHNQYALRVQYVPKG